MERTRRGVLAGTIGLTVLAGCQSLTDDGDAETGDGSSDSEPSIELDVPDGMTETGIDADHEGVWFDRTPFIEPPTHQWAAYDHRAEATLIDDDGQRRLTATREGTVVSEPLRGFFLDDIETTYDVKQPDQYTATSHEQTAHVPYQETFLLVSRSRHQQDEATFRSDDHLFWVEPATEPLLQSVDHATDDVRLETVEIEPARRAYYEDLEQSIDRLFRWVAWAPVALSDPIVEPEAQRRSSGLTTDTVEFTFDSVEAETAAVDDPVTIPATGELTATTEGLVKSLSVAVEREYRSDLDAEIDAEMSVNSTWESEAVETVTDYSPDDIVDFDDLFDERDLHCTVSADLVAIRNDDSRPLYGPLSISVFVDGGVFDFLFLDYTPNREARFDEPAPPLALDPGETLYITSDPIGATGEHHHFVDDRPDDRGTFIAGGSRVRDPPEFTQDDSFVFVKRERIPELLRDVEGANGTEAVDAYYAEYSDRWGPIETQGYDIVHLVDQSPTGDPDL